jgi:hypothetical protein
MDCIEAQGLISAGMDREPVPASSLTEAREHCRTCPQCSAFASAQLAARQAHLPEPPADLADRTMARVRAEAETMAAEKAVVVAQSASGPAAPEASVSDIRIPAFMNATLAPKPKKESRLGRRWNSIGLAVAVLAALLGTGAVIVFGMHLVSLNPSGTNRGAYVFKGEAASTAGQSDLAASAPAPQAAGPDAITLKGVVFIKGESSSIDTHTLTEVGTVSSSLGGAGPASTRTAYRDPQGTSKIYVADDDATVWEFKTLTHDYMGDTYVLVSGELARFGQWPMLPRGIDAPADANGGTTFSKGGTDSTGARVFLPSNPLTTYGSDVVVPGVSSAPPMIALAPNTAGDPLAADPNWTLWLQLP